ncbi:hypothetical protein [Vibrio algarum]|uniref:Uncharacterized protein n=1 Tax=Vibrio algarum TaxID=3020714 RepID=A0ABT4YMQ3_9VIBR|nr:hypothetical protein [Vibrio sp. KJ40-1]MDB1122827.1 hypothetical protein [Vibrio sp. KJ40-1]
MYTPLHSINIDFSHSSEAKAFEESINVHLNAHEMGEDEFVFFFNLREQALEAIELLESLEV